MAQKMMIRFILIVFSTIVFQIKNANHQSQFTWRSQNIHAIAFFGRCNLYRIQKVPQDEKIKRKDNRYDKCISSHHILLTVMSLIFTRPATPTSPSPYPHPHPFT